MCVLGACISKSMQQVLWMKYFEMGLCIYSATTYVYVGESQSGNSCLVIWWQVSSAIKVSKSHVIIWKTKYFLSKKGQHFNYYDLFPLDGFGYSNNPPKKYPVSMKVWWTFIATETKNVKVFGDICNIYDFITEGTGKGPNHDKGT